MSVHRDPKSGRYFVRRRESSTGRNRKRTFDRKRDADEWDTHVRRIFKPAAVEAGLTNEAVPYDLRHAAVTVWIHEGCSVVEVAAWLGHSPTQTLSTYAHFWGELSDAPRLGADEAIRRAREACAVPASPLPLRTAPVPSPLERRESYGSGAFSGEPTAGLEPATPSLRGPSGRFLEWGGGR